MNNQPVFAIDCDEVLRKTLDAMVALYNKHFNANKTRDDIDDFICENSFPDIKSTTGVSASHWFFQEHGKELFLETDPFPGIKEDIERLRKYGKVIVVTYQKSYQNKIDTLMWLDKNGIEVDGVCFLKDKTLLVADYLVDDNDWNFAGSQVKHAVLVNAPYNKDVTEQKIRNASSYISTVTRVESLHEFVDLYEQAAKEVELVENNYGLPGEKKYVLKDSVPYKDNTIYQREYKFSKAGEYVIIGSPRIFGVTAYVNVQLCNSWGSVSVKVSELEKYI